MLMENPKRRGILIVEDDLNLRSALELLLSESGHENVLVALDGTEAVSILASHGEEMYVVILDLMMPKMDGLGVMKHLANVHCYPVGVIVLTGYASLERATSFYELSTDNVIAARFLEKPCSFDDLLAEVDKTLEKIHTKRIQQMEISSKNIFQRIVDLERRIAVVVDTSLKMETNLDSLVRRQQGFLAQLGVELLKAIVIALAVIAIVYFGIDDFIRDIIQGSP